MSIRPEEITVLEDIQEDYKVYDREITPNESLPKNILVTDDDLSNRLYFNMWHTFDDRELINKQISIIWLNANDEKGVNDCGDINIIPEEHRLTFSWNVPKEATYKAGIIKFAIRINFSDNYVWNSLPSTVEVKQGLQLNNYPEAVIPSESKLSLMLIDKEEYDSLETKNPQIVYVVKDVNNYSMYINNSPIREIK